MLLQSIVVAAGDGRQTPASAIKGSRSRHEEAAVLSRRSNPSPVAYDAASIHASAARCLVDAALRDVERTRSLAEETLRLASERGFAILRLYVSMFLRWCDVAEGRAEAGAPSSPDRQVKLRAPGI